MAISRLNSLSLPSLPCSPTVLLVFLVIALQYPKTATALGNETDFHALLAIKSQLVDHPDGVLSSWDHSTDHCQWNGVTCSRKHNRVIILKLDSSGLAGTISPFIGNLSFLQEILLNNNSLSGQIPSELGRLSRLRYMILSNNTLVGEIPASLSSCFNLMVIDVSANKLEGKLPTNLGALSQLKYICVAHNRFEGPLFQVIASLTSLEVIDASWNAFNGTIHESVCMMLNLTEIDGAENRLTGVVPSCFFNLSNLQQVDLCGNRLQGELPANIGFTLPKLNFLGLSNNTFSGSIPLTLSNLTNLTYIGLDQNRFTGGVPQGLGQLRHLYFLQLYLNHLTGDINFLGTLVNCRNLQTLDISSCGFTGKIPDSIANMSTVLTKLKIGNNPISGTIPAGITNLTNLTTLDMSNTLLTGSLPHGLGELRNLVYIYLNSNRLTGNIPHSLTNLSSLIRLNLGSNKLEGSIPPGLGNCRSLQNLNLSNNRLNGTLGKELFNGPALVSLDLSHNQLEGHLPLENSLQNSILNLNLARNKFSGLIPDGLGTCRELQYLIMDGNSFHGEIPPSFASLTSLQMIDLSSNKLSGPVPTSGIFENASAINLVGNGNLCGGITELHLPKCDDTEGMESKTLMLLVSVSAVVGVLGTGAGLYITCTRKRKTQLSSGPTMGKEFMKVSYNMLLKATNGFSSKNLLGAGHFGSVYEGILDGKIFAVKVLNLQRRGASKSFMAECNALRNIRHRNIVGIVTSCSSTDFQGNDFRALVYEFMPNGSLDRWINGAGNLSLLQRVDIAIDVAHAIQYLHHECETPILHCDLKPSNILLSDDMVAQVGDLGLAKISSQPHHSNQSSTNGIKGTVGYAAPEYGLGNEASRAGDVYSYGILLLELMTGKSPTDNMFKEDLSLHMYAEAALPDQVMQIIDPTLGEDNITEEADEEKVTEDAFLRRVECIASVISAGVSCSKHLAHDRMKISDAISKLQTARNILLNGTTFLYEAEV